MTLLNLALAVPIAFRVRLMRRQRLLTTIPVVPIMLGTVLISEGLLNYSRPMGWFNRALVRITRTGGIFRRGRRIDDRGIDDRRF